MNDVDEYDVLFFRAKRQYPYYGFQNAYDNSQSTAQSNSHSHDFGPFGSQNADALAAAQGKFNRCSLDPEK